MKFSVRHSCHLCQGRVTWIVLAVCAVLVAAPAEARQFSPPPSQTPTQPPLSPTQTPAEREPEEEKPRGEGPPIWLFSLGASQSYESDVQFSGTTGNGDWSQRLDGRGGRRWTLRRGHIDAGGDVSQVFYRRANGLNRLMYGLNANMSYDLTRRLHFSASEFMSLGYSENSAPLVTAGLLYPRVLTRTNVASTAIVYQMTPRTTVSGDVSQTTVTFPDSITGGLSNGTSVIVRGAMSRTLTKTQSVGVSFGNTFSSGTTGDIQGLLGTWQGSWGRRLTLNGALGIRPYTLPGETGHRFAPGGSFGVTSRFGRGQSLSASYERAVEQAYGLARTHLAHRFNGNYGIAASRRLSFEAGASYGVNSYPQDVNYSLDGTTLTTGMQYRLLGDIFLSAGYGLWSRHESGISLGTTYRTFVSLSYGRSFPRTRTRG